MPNPPARPEIPPTIAASGLEKTFTSRDGSVVHALSRTDLAIRDAEFITIVGPSGCGKSTLLKLLAGLIERSAGEIRIRGNAVSGPQADIGMVFQSPVLLPWKTTLDNVLLPADVLCLDKAQSTARAKMLLETVGLRDFMQKYPHELSGGMQQRTAIARALLHDPGILLMDEPFGALDAMTRENLNMEIRRIWLASKKTILFVTHSIPEAVFLGTRVLVLSPRPGRITEIVDVDLPEDRDLDIMASDAFGVYARRIRHHFNAKGTIE